MRDGCFERRLSRCPLDVEVNPLPVFSRFGKLVDAILRNVEPVADADLLAEILVELIDTVDMNHGSMPAITRSVWYREAVAPRSPGLSLRLPWGSEPQDASTATRLRQKSRNLNVLGINEFGHWGATALRYGTSAALFGHDFNSAGSQISSLHPDHHRRTSSPCRNVTCVASSLRAVAQ